MYRSQDSWNDDDFNFIRRPPPPSGLISAVGIITIIYGSISLFCSGISGLLSLVIVAADQAAILGREFMMSWGVFWLLSAGSFFVTCVGGIVGGIGVLNRRKTARWTVIVVAFVQLSLAGFYTYVVYAIGRQDDRDVNSLVFMIVGLALMYGYSLLALIALFLPRCREEFQ